MAEGARGARAAFDGPRSRSPKETRTRSLRLRSGHAMDISHADTQAPHPAAFQRSGTRDVSPDFLYASSEHPKISKSQGRPNTRPVAGRTPRNPPDIRTAEHPSGCGPNTPQLTRSTDGRTTVQLDARGRRNVAISRAEFVPARKEIMEVAGADFREGSFGTGYYLDPRKASLTPYIPFSTPSVTPHETQGQEKRKEKDQR